MKKEKYLFAQNINGTAETGIINVSANPPTLLCLCTKENSTIILNKLNSNQEEEINHTDTGDGYACGRHNYKPDITDSALNGLSELIRSLSVINNRYPNILSINDKERLEKAKKTLRENPSSDIKLKQSINITLNLESLLDEELQYEVERRGFRMSPYTDD